MVKRKVKNQIADLIPDHLKLGITLIYLLVGVVPYTIGKLSIMATTLL
jgi:hypothetical protein